MNDSMEKPKKTSGKSLKVLAVIAVFLLIAGVGTIIFTLYYSGIIFNSNPQSVNTAVYKTIPKNATPLKKVVDNDIANFEQAADSPASKLIDVPYINQKAKYPTGCESVSAVMALKYAGYDITPDDFIDNYLPKSPTPYIDESGKLYGYNPYIVFLGNPYSAEGWGCYYPVIGRCLLKIVDRSRHKVVNLHKAPFSKLVSYIDRDTPVIIWATQGMSEPQRTRTWKLADGDGSFTWVKPNHCLLLVGYDKTGYYFNDPLTHKNCRYPADIVEKRYAAMGRQALAIVKK